MCLPYSACHAFSMFRRVPAGSLLAPLWLRFGSLLGTLGTQKSPKRATRTPSQKHAKMIPAKMPICLPKDLPDRVSKFTIWSCVGLRGPPLPPNWCKAPLWPQFHQKYIFFTPIRLALGTNLGHLLIKYFTEYRYKCLRKKKMASAPPYISSLLVARFLGRVRYQCT